MAEIREFRAEWADAVDEILLAAFGGCAEADLVRALRDSDDTAVELVAREADVAVGYIRFSPLAADPPSIRVAALAPVAVALLGDPAYYRRFGFTRRAAQALESVYSGLAFQALELREGALAGGLWTVRFAEAFDRLD